VIAALILGLDLFIGLATLGRISSAGSEELNCVRGMNRIRHAYLEMVPSLEPYFVAPWHDDPAGILAAYSTGPDSGGPIGDLLHAFTTTPGMIGVIDAVIAGALGSVIAIAVGASAPAAVVVGVAIAIVFFLVGAAIGFRMAFSWMSSVPVRFPSPPSDQDGASTGG
jgi:hypothetical protein